MSKKKKKNIKFEEEKKPDYGTVRIADKAWNKMCNYLRASEGEIGGILVIDDSEGLLIEDIIITKQKVTGGHFELDAEDLGRTITEIMTKNPELMPKMKGWWHSHSTFGCFWSLVDDATTERFLNYGMKYCVSIVQSENLKKGQKKGEGQMYCLIKVSLKKPRIDLDGLSFIIEGESVNEHEKNLEEVEKKVKFETIKPFKNTWKDDWYGDGNFIPIVDENGGVWYATEEDFKRFRKYHFIQ